MKHAERLQLGVDLAIEIAEAVSPRDVNERVVARVAEAMDADRVVLYRLDDDHAVAEAAFDNTRPAAPGFRVRVGDDTPMRRALMTREVAVASHPQFDTQPPEQREAIASVLHYAVLPLVHGGRVIGYLAVGRRRDVPFDSDGAETLAVIGRVVAVTLRNARLIADASSARDAMSEFLRVIMHELRGPLAIMAGYMSMIEEGVFGDVSPNLDRVFRMIDAKVREANGLVDELLLISRLEDGIFPAREEEVDLRAATMRAIDRAQPRAELMNASIGADTVEGAVACADARDVDRILDNLISNALTYGGDPPNALVEVRRGDPVEVSVSDNGPGVDPADRDRIFERFYRGRGTAPGVGLGLYISRMLAERSGGSLDLEPPANGSGARFTLRLPAVRRAPAPA